jgi:hypothetical protein
MFVPRCQRIAAITDCPKMLSAGRFWLAFYNALEGAESDNP